MTPTAPVSQFTFSRAVKTGQFLRMALDGPTGGGKTWTALVIATLLCDRFGGRVALVDSERSSALKYADHFDFDHLTLPDHGPKTYIGAIKAAEAAGYTVTIVDSLSHAWEGTLEMKDKVTARSTSKNSYDAWRHVTPVHNELVDLLLRGHFHTIVTMRSKMEYLIEEKAGKMTGVKKIGLKPIQRDGVEYEFDIILDMDPESNTATVSKTRCPAIKGEVVQEPGPEFAATIYDWLVSGERTASIADQERIKEAFLTIPEGTRRAATKFSFVARFGRPDNVLVSKVEEALAWIAVEAGTSWPELEPLDTGDLRRESFEAARQDDEGSIEYDEATAAVVPLHEPADSSAPVDAVAVMERLKKLGADAAAAFLAWRKTSGVSLPQTPDQIAEVSAILDRFEPAAAVGEDPF